MSDRKTNQQNTEAYPQERCLKLEMFYMVRTVNVGLNMFCK